LIKNVLNAIRARAITIIVWAVIIAAIIAFNSYNQSQRAAATSALGSSSQAVRDAEVLKLAHAGGLVDALGNTQNLNEDANSPTNQESVLIRQEAVDSMNRLVASNQLSADQALPIYFSFYKDSDSKVKSSSTDAISALGKQNSANLTAIVQRLKDDDPDLRAASVEALGKVGSDDAAKQVADLLSDKTSRDAAELGLASIGKASVPYLTVHINDPDSDYSQKMISILGGIGDSGAVPALIATVNTASAATRRVGVVAIANIVLATYNARDKAVLAAKTAPASTPPSGPTPQAIATVNTSEPLLIALATSSGDDPDARALATLSLGRIGGNDAISALVKSLQDFDPKISNAAVAALQAVGSPAVSPLIALLNDSKVRVDTRASAAEALGGIGSPEAIASLNGAFASPQTPSAIRRSAALGLGNSGAVAVIPTLVKALGDKDGVVASIASAALLNPDLQDGAIPQLISAFQEKTPVPFEASQTLARMGNVPVPALKTALQGSNTVAQTWSAVTLGQIGTKDPTVVAELTPLADSTTPSVKWAASQAIDQLTGS